MSIKLKSGTELPLMNLKGKDYLQVAYRLVWFREEHPDWCIETKIIELNDNVAVVRAEVRNDKGHLVASAHQSESAKSFPKFLAKAETAAIGRALAMCGYGTQFEPELDEGDELADAPIERKKQNKTQPIQDETNKPSGGNNSVPENSRVVSAVSPIDDQGSKQPSISETDKAEIEAQSSEALERRLNKAFLMKTTSNKKTWDTYNFMLSTWEKKTGKKMDDRSKLKFVEATNG